jgi:hypothetical protein
VKKLVFSVIILAALSAPLFAQRFSEGKESEYFYVGIPVEKVYPYKKGYVVQYRKGVTKTAQAYLPLEWFNGTGDVKGNLVYLGTGSSWPYLIVYYKNGELSHVRLYVRRDQRHETWGIIPVSTNIDDRFENTGDLRLEF